VAASSGAIVAPPDYTIGPDDVLAVMFWRDKDLSAEVVVRPDGKISLPLLNDIEAGGLTPEQLRERVLEQARRFVEDPSASVVVKQVNSRKVFITGEVAKPGTYPLTGPTTVLQLIATAGGLKEFVDGNNIVVMRTESGRQVRYRFSYKSVVKGKNVKQNIELKPGDTVVVP
jgi:polysaccharide export outer membrane protein